MNKRLLATILFFTFFICCFANRKLEKQLLGSWKISIKDSAGFIIPNKQTIQFFSFYKSGQFQIDEKDIIIDSTQNIYGQRFYYGKWEINRKDDSLSTWKSNALMGLIGYDRDYKIASLTDSALVLSYSIATTKYNLHLARVKPIVEIKPSSEINFVKVKEIHSPKDDLKFVLVNSADTSKKVLINASDGINVSIEESTSDTTIESIKSWTGGEIVGITDSAIQLKTYDFKTHIQYKNDSSKTLEKNYNVHGGLIRTIELHKISSFSYTSKKQNARNVFFGSMATIAGMNLLFVAPLVSINYLKGGFNSKRYFTWAGISLLSLGICIPISQIFTERDFKLTMKNSITNRDYWYFEN